MNHTGFGRDSELRSGDQTDQVAATAAPGRPAAAAGTRAFLSKLAARFPALSAAVEFPSRVPYQKIRPRVTVSAAAQPTTGASSLLLCFGAWPLRSAVPATRAGPPRNRRSTTRVSSWSTLRCQGPRTTGSVRPQRPRSRRPDVTSRAVPGPTTSSCVHRATAATARPPQPPRETPQRPLRPRRTESATRSVGQKARQRRAHRETREEPR